MPHTRYICETSGRRVRPFTIEYTKNECCPLPFIHENCHIFDLGVENTFQYVCAGCPAATKLEKFPNTDNTHREH